MRADSNTTRIGLTFWTRNSSTSVRNLSTALFILHNDPNNFPSRYFDVDTAKGEPPMTLTDDVKQVLTIVDVVSEYVPLEKLHTRSPEAPCPFHEERTPSFKLNLESDTWRCYGACGTGGDIFSFVMRADGIPFVEALDKLCDQAGLERRPRTDAENEHRPTKSERESVHELNALAADYWHKQLRGEAGNNAREYLESRGIDVATAQQWGIGYAPSGSNSLLHFLAANKVPKSATVRSGLLTKPEHGQWRDMFINRIMFALRDRNGDIIGFGGRAMDESEAKYINTSETQYFQKSELVYGLDRAADAIATTGRAVVVEGYMDVITAHEHGFRNVVACMGTAVTQQQLAAIANALPHDSQPARQIVMCLDNDDAGVNATLNGLGVAIAQFSSANGAISSSIPVDIKVARPVSSGDGAPKDPDEAIRQDPQTWWRSIETPSEAHEFAFESRLGSGTVDEAITTAMPFIGKIPPSTVAARRRIEWMSEKVGIQYDDMLDLLIQKRRDQAPAQTTITTSNRRVTRRENTTRTSQHLDQQHLRFKPYEFELVACLAQHESALDYIANLNPAHFESRELGAIVELRLRCASVNETARAIAMDDALDALYAELMQHPIQAEIDGESDETGELSKIVSACTKRVKQNHLRRCKEHESEIFKQDEVLSNDERMEEMLQQANINNRQLSELTAS